MDFDDLGLRAALLRSVREQGYRTPTPVQAWAIPAILTGRDLAAAALPGSGTTAAYALPMLQRLMGVRRGARGLLRALVFVPTPEAAAHVARRVRAYGAHLPFRCEAAGSAGTCKPRAAAARGIDIAVATPSQVLDPAGGCSLDVSGIELVVLDGVDGMLRMGLLREIRHVFARMPGRRQTVVFGEAFPNQAMVLAGRLVRDPEPMDRRPSARPREAAGRTVAGVVRASRILLLRAHGVASPPRGAHRARAAQQRGPAAAAAASPVTPMPCG